MKKLVFIFLFFSIFLFGDEAQIVKQKNVLSVQNLIKREELIAEAFEKYLLTEFKIPALNLLNSANYLGTNFDFTNNMGDYIDYFDSSNLKLKFAIKKPYQNYVYDLYVRDLYRSYTSAVVNKTDEEINTVTSYIALKIQSEEAQNIYNLLIAANTILSTCSVPKALTYCSKNKEYIRWYNDDLDWIEYSKKEMNNGNVTVSNISIFTTDVNKLNELPVGTLIHVENKGKYIKTILDNEFKEVN